MTVKYHIVRLFLLLSQRIYKTGVGLLWHLKIAPCTLAIRHHQLLLPCLFVSTTTCVPFRSTTTTCSQADKCGHAIKIRSTIREIFCSNCGNPVALISCTNAGPTKKIEIQQFSIKNLDF